MKPEAPDHDSATTLTNPYWDAVKHHLLSNRLFGDGLMIPRWNLTGGPDRDMTGDRYDGCTGNRHLHDRLDKYWEQIDDHTPVQWEGLHDTITVYRRR
jgi:hypothetical protein